MSAAEVDIPTLPQNVQNLVDLQCELETVSSALMAAPAVPVTRVESNEEGPSTTTDASSFITLMPAPVVRPTPIPPPNFPVEVGELAVSPSTVRISTDEQLNQAGLIEGEMTLIMSMPDKIHNGPPTNGRYSEPHPKFAEQKDSMRAAPVPPESGSPEESPTEDTAATGKIDKFTCNYCGKLFSYKLSWINHELTHAGVMPYECKRCGKSFPYRSSLQNHETIPGRCKVPEKPNKSVGIVSPSVDAQKGRKSVIAIASTSTTVSPDSVKRPSLESKEIKTAEQSEEISPPKLKPGRGRPKKIRPVEVITVDSEDDGVADEISQPAEPKAKRQIVVKKEESKVVPRNRSRPSTGARRGRPPKAAHASLKTARASFPPAAVAVAGPSRFSEKRTPPCPTETFTSDSTRSRSKRKIQPPVWMRNMDMDYEIPVTHGIFQGDGLAPVSTGANWRAVNSITNPKRRKTGQSDDDDEDDVDAEDVEIEHNQDEGVDAADNPDNESNLVIDDDDTTEEMATPNGPEIPEVHIPKKRGRKKKILSVTPNARPLSTEKSTADQSNETADSLQNDSLSDAEANNDGAGQKSVGTVKRPISVGPETAKRNLRGLPHRANAVIPTPKQENESTAEDEEEETNDSDMEQDSEEDDTPTTHQEEETVDEEMNVEESADTLDESAEGQQELNVNENYEEEEEEEDTDVLNDSDNEEQVEIPLPPDGGPAVVSVRPQVQVIQPPPPVRAALMAPPAPHNPDMDLKTSAVTFLYKKISNRNMLRVREELKDLTDRGDYFQLTQWAPLAAGFLQAMLLRDFSRDTNTNNQG